MDRKQVYTKTDEFLKGRWGSIIIVHLITFAITAAISMIVMTLFIGNIIEPLMYSLQYGDDYLALAAITSAISSIFLVVSITGIVGGFIKAGLNMQVYKSYRYGEKINFSLVISNISENFGSIFVIVALVGVIQFGVSSIPFLRSMAGIINTIITLAVSFSLYILVDNKVEGGVEALTESYAATNGHKFNLWVIGIYYVLRPFIGFLFMFVGLFFIDSIPALAGLLMFVGLIVMAVLAIKYIPYRTAAEAIYYAELQELNAPSFVDVEVNETVVEPEVVVAAEVVVDETPEETVVEEVEIAEEAEVVEPEIVETEVLEPEVTEPTDLDVKPIDVKDSED